MRFLTQRGTREMVLRKTRTRGDVAPQPRFKRLRRGAATIGVVAVLVLASVGAATPTALGASFDHAVAWGYFVGPKPAQVGELLGVTAVAAEKRGGDAPQVATEN